MATVPIRSLTPQRISHAVITAAMTVHTELGPGLLESAYSACLLYELKQAGFLAVAQVALPVVYRGVKLELGYRMDLLMRICWLSRSSLSMASLQSIRLRFFRTLNSVVNPSGCL
jgi:PD-(D/E)XK nuclease superfamily